jgi:hypothetical protein
MTLFNYPPLSVSIPAGAATEVTAAAILVDTTAIASGISTIVTQTKPIGLFTKPYDEIETDVSGSGTNVYVTKLAGVTVQTLTITYSDTTKNQAINHKVV